MTVAKKERPILFSGPMVRAILEERKTQTRRVVKGRVALEWLAPGMFSPEFVANSKNHLCPYGQPGDRLWVRETFTLETNRGLSDESVYPPPFNDGRPVRRFPENGESGLYWQQPHYRATDPTPDLMYEDYYTEDPNCKWTPSIHMPRWASRILLEVTGVSVERLQEISEDDAFAEGISGGDWLGDPVGTYRSLWESINGSGSWESNPWVWVVEFRRSAA